MSGRVGGPQPGFPAAGLPGPRPGSPRPGSPAAAAGSFAGTLAQAMAPLRFSHHASQRLAAAGRSLSPDELQRLGSAVETAARKGSRQCLLLLSDLALVVHAPSRTVITAVTDQRRQGGLFTDIDSTVIL